MPHIILLPQENVPERLLRIFPPPRQLYLRGTLPDLENFKCLAVVGARRYSAYGMEVCRELIKGLAGYPIIIISGLAIGIDSISHQAALDANLLTIAVPGSGLGDTTIYPKAKRPLAKEILERGGCMLSEYPPDELSQAWYFPERNRIMAGLADAVLIIEAEKKSGTLITARLALDYNKDVLVVPGPIFSPLSEGPHYLIKEGATPITSSKDIVEALGLVWRENKESGATLFDQCFEQCTSEEKELLAFLPCTRDELVRSLPHPTHQTQSLISLLEMKGFIKEELGKINMSHFTF